tara:strand:+ start:590 stop:1222 length:633 start_codon:yes stop_codon:yes gene_type:complete
MIFKQGKDKGILAKLLEKGIKILLKKECNKISKIKIDIIASSIQIIKGIIEKIYIIAEEVNYKELLFDKIELEANQVQISLKLNNNEIKLNNNLIIKFTISLSENSLKTILISNRWNWIGDVIAKEMLDQDKIENLRIINNKIVIKASNNKKTLSQEEIVFITAEKGRIYLENKKHNKSIKIPIEEKVYIKNLNVQNNIITFSANSSISF